MGGWLVGWLGGGGGGERRKVGRLTHRIVSEQPVEGGNPETSMTAEELSR